MVVVVVGGMVVEVEVEVELVVVEIEVAGRAEVVVWIGGVEAAGVSSEPAHAAATRAVTIRSEAKRAIGPQDGARACRLQLAAAVGSGSGDDGPNHPPLSCGA
jgi:hypothetical protein